MKGSYLYNSLRAFAARLGLARGDVRRAGGREAVVNLGVESTDFLAHGGSAFIVLAIGFGLGATFTPAAAIAVAWLCGLIRELTKWQAGIVSPFSPASIRDQCGWIAGGVAFALVARP